MLNGLDNWKVNRRIERTRTECCGNKNALDEWSKKR